MNKAKVNRAPINRGCNKPTDLRRIDHKTDAVMNKPRALRRCDSDEFHQYEKQMKAMFGNTRLPAVQLTDRIMPASFLRN